LTLLVELKIPLFNPEMKTALVESVYCDEGAELALGAKILDVSVDLSGAFAQNCPPISYYRMVLRDRLWLRKLFFAPGDSCEAGARFALLSTEPDESLAAEPARAARCMTAGIVYHDGMWSGRAA
jgi:hypothetical protein